MNKTYTAYAALVTAALAYALYFGFSMTRVDEVKQVPKTVRDNPGAYRAHYRSYSHHYWGGK